MNDVFHQQDLPVPETDNDPSTFFQDEKDRLILALKKSLADQGRVKWHARAVVDFTRMEGEDIARIPGRFNSYPQILLRGDQIDEQIDLAFNALMLKIENFESEGSGYKIEKLDELQLSSAHYDPILGSSYIPLLKKIGDKKAIVNVQNKDNRCFEYSVLAAIHPSTNSHPERVKQYKKHIGELDFTGIDFPVKLHDIPKFEKNNPLYSIGVLQQDGLICPLYASPHRDRIHINLFYLSETVKVMPDGTEELVNPKEPLDDSMQYIHKSHYCYIKNLSRLLHASTNHDGNKFSCPYCLHRNYTQKRLNHHLGLCSTNAPCRIIFPSKFVKEVDADLGDQQNVEDLLEIDADVAAAANAADELPPNILRFTKQQYEHPVPFTIYGDFESFIDENGVHTASGFCLLVTSPFDFLDNQLAYTYSGPDVLKHFFDQLAAIRVWIEAILSQNKPMTPMTGEQEYRHKQATHCQQCRQQFTSGNVKVHHHCHISGLYLSASCNSCNLKLKCCKVSKAQLKEIEYMPKEREFLVPVIFHSLKSYDSHLIIKALDKYNASDISVIASTTEKFISFTIGGYRFIDSLAFLNASLDTLVTVLKKGGEFKHTMRHFPDHVDLVLRKGCFPYEFVDSSIDKFNDTQLPPIEAFHSKLSDEGITDSEYEYAQTVWKTFNMKTMKDYHDLYLTTDVLLLADVFENFRKLAMANYALDPAHFVTLPGMVYQAALRYTGVHLELLTDIDQLLFFESGIRGGVSTITGRYAKSNIPDTEDYDPSLPPSYISYLDMNNLYRTVMQFSLPICGFRWLSLSEIKELKIMEIDDDAEIGYTLEVDLDYPEHLHDAHNDLPLAPEHFEITPEILSPLANQLLTDLDKKPAKRNKKLVPNLSNKTKYVVHYRNLKFYLQMGLKLKFIHRVIEYKQSKWLAPYIDFNTEKRKEATTDFKNNLYKLSNNTVFGKFCENLRKRQDVKIVTGQKEAERLVAKPNYNSFTIISPNATMVKLDKTSIYWDRPSFVGQTILNLFKLEMFKFHYQQIVPFYTRNGHCRAKLLFTDTDSLCYHIETEDVYADIRLRPDLYDFSNFPKDHPNYSKTNEKVLGKMKDETGGVPSKEFVGLRSKMYSLLLSDGTDKTTAKGVKTSYVKKHMKHDLYKKCLFTKQPTTASFTIFQSHNHQIQTVDVTKVALSPYDDKRFLLENTYQTLAYGHRRIKQISPSAAAAMKAIVDAKRAESYEMLTYKEDETARMNCF